MYGFTITGVQDRRSSSGYFKVETGQNVTAYVKNGYTNYHFHRTGPDPVGRASRFADEHGGTVQVDDQGRVVVRVNHP